MNLKILLISQIFVTFCNVIVLYSNEIQYREEMVCVETYNGLKFPSNGDNPINAYIAFQYDNPQNNGLPIWGPNKQGVSYIWEYYPIQQKGYYVTFWWANNGSFQWKDGDSDSYYGCHPYPKGGAPRGQTATSHYWELAGMASGTDNISTLSGSPLTVDKGVWYTQAFRVHINADGTKTGRFYIDISDTSKNNIIEYTAKPDWGESNPPFPALIFGDSPWGHIYYGTERMSGILGRIKIFNKSLSLNDLKKEALDMSKLVTAEGKKNIWWGKTSFKSVDDLFCDYGSKRSFHWANSKHKARLIEIKKKNNRNRTIKFETEAIDKCCSITLPIYICINNTTIYSVKVLRGKHFTVNIIELPQELNAGDSLLLNLKFESKTIGELRDTLLISNSSSVNPLSLYLKGICEYNPCVPKKYLKHPDRFYLGQKIIDTYKTLKTINYQLLIPSNVELIICNIYGQKVKDIVQKKQPAGHYSIKWDGQNNDGFVVPPGIYFYSLIIGKRIRYSKLILIY